MAITITHRIKSANDEQYNALTITTGEAIQRFGGPPDGLLIHLAYPDGADILVVEAWRSEDAIGQWYDDVIYPSLTAHGLDAERVGPVPVYGLMRH